MNLQCRMDDLNVTAIYPGSFDPPTRGHLDLIRRSSRLFDRLVVAILRNDAKQPLFSMDERVDMLRECLGGIENTEVDQFEGLLVDYAVRRDARVLIRGIRAVSDYEYELQMTSMNRQLRPEIELPASCELGVRGRQRGDPGPAVVAEHADDERSETRLDGQRGPHGYHHERWPQTPFGRCSRMLSQATRSLFRFDRADRISLACS